MPVTLANLIRHSSLGLTVVAGAPALDREVSWVHTSELLDPTPYLQGGELLLTLGMWMSSARGAGEAAAYVERLVRAGVVGLGFGIGVTHGAMPPPLVDAAAAAGLPLIAVPEHTPFIAISRTVWEVLAA